MTDEQLRARVAAYFMCGLSPARARILAERDRNDRKAFLMRKTFAA